MESHYICRGTEEAVNPLLVGTYLEEALQNQFVCGLMSETLQKQLLVKDFRKPFISPNQASKLLKPASCKAMELQLSQPHSRHWTRL